MAETPSNNSYKYTPSSAKSTRQILDSTSATISPPPPSIASGPSSLPLRPQDAGRKSSNYAEADARARAALVESSNKTYSSPQNTGESDINKEENLASSEGTPSSAGWKPTFGRKQSWSQQDMKRVLQMSTVLNEGVDNLPGYSERKK